VAARCDAAGAVVLDASNGARRRPISYPPPRVSLLEDIKSYIGFGEADAEALRALLPEARPHFPGIAQRFYDLILAHPSAHAAITGGNEQVERLKKTLVAWMETGLSGPHDEAYFERRSRIGRVHVDIGLPQRFMFTAMNAIRLDFHDLAREHRPDRDACKRTMDALDKLFDMELAIMLGAYQTDSEQRLRKRERLAVIGQIAASIGHELRNPLGVIRSSTYLLRRYTDQAKALRHVDKIEHQVDRCTRIIEGLLELTRERPVDRRPVDLARLVDEAAAALRDAGVLGEDAAIVFEADDPTATRLLADPPMLGQLLSNLLENALVAGEARRVVVRATRTADAHVLEVCDDGKGFPPEILQRAFEPLVSTRPHGTGLGLSLVMAIARRHGGTAEAANRTEGGARVTVTLPAMDGDDP